MYSKSSKIKTKSKVVLKEYQKHVVLIDSKLKTIKKIKKNKRCGFHCFVVYTASMAQFL